MRNGIPGLQPQVHQSKAWMLDVEVQVQALAQFQVRFQLLGLVIASFCRSGRVLHIERSLPSPL